MSEKLAIVRRWVELYNERTDVTEFLSLLDPEVELQTPGGPRLRGHDQPDRLVEEGDVVAGLRRTEVRWIESGEIAREFESAAVFWFRDGKIVRWQPCESHDAALTTAGLSV
jgi:hypothetical protein